MRRGVAPRKLSVGGLPFSRNSPRERGEYMRNTRRGVRDLASAGRNSEGSGKKFLARANEIGSRARGHRVDCRGRSLNRGEKKKRLQRRRAREKRDAM